MRFMGVSQQICIFQDLGPDVRKNDSVIPDQELSRVQPIHSVRVQLIPLRKNPSRISGRIHQARSNRFGIRARGSLLKRPPLSSPDTRILYDNASGVLFPVRGGNPREGLPRGQRGNKEERQHRHSDKTKRKSVAKYRRPSEWVSSAQILTYIMYYIITSGEKEVVLRIELQMWITFL